MINDVMTKDEVKTVAEDDPKLQWWAMVLFGEISELMSCWEGPHPDTAVMNVVKAKVLEFPRLVVQRTLEKAKEAQEKAK